MAWWVVWGHMALFAGYSGRQENLPWFMDVALRGGIPVDVFVTLSGFVIFMLLDRARSDSYPSYLLGRFFRLYPTYLFCLLAALSVSPLLPTLLSAPWGDAHHLSEGVKRLAYQEGALLQHIALHLSLLHGLVPDQWLPYAGDSILGPAWSLSLEWQFYLLAPFFFYAATRGHVWWLLVCIALLFIKLQMLNSGLTFNWGGFLPLKFEFFMLGMGSFFVWREVLATGMMKRPVGILFAGLSAAYVVMFFVGGMREHFFSIAIWLAVFFSALFKARSGRGNLLSRMLASPAMLYVGRMSYVTYIFHMVAVQGIGYLMVVHMEPHTSRPIVFGVMLLFGSVLAFAGSMLIHKCVEMPGIELGKAVRRRSFAKEQKAV